MNETLDEQSRCSLVRYRIERADETIDEAIHKRYTKGTVLFVYVILGNWLRNHKAASLVSPGSHAKAMA